MSVGVVVKCSSIHICSRCSDPVFESRIRCFLSSLASGFQLMGAFLSSQITQAFSSDLVKFYPHRPEGFSKISSIFILTWTRASISTLGGPGEAVGGDKTGAPQIALLC